VVTTDGSIAIFHAREYWMDWMNVDGSRSVGVRMPFPWRKIANADRLRLLDSVNEARRHLFDSLTAKRAADSARTGAGIKVPGPTPSKPALIAIDDIPISILRRGQRP